MRKVASRSTRGAPLLMEAIIKSPQAEAPANLRAAWAVKACRTTAVRIFLILMGISIEEDMGGDMGGDSPGVHMDGGMAVGDAQQQQMQEEMYHHQQMQQQHYMQM